MTAPANRYPGPCGSCGTHVAAEAGTRVQIGGRWTVRCVDHPHTTSALPALVQQRADEDTPRATELRITGSPAECTAIVDAVRAAVGTLILDVSQPRPRREADDDRVSVYVRVHVDGRLVAAIEREEAQA